MSVYICIQQNSDSLLQTFRLYIVASFVGDSHSWACHKNIVTVLLCCYYCFLFFLFFIFVSNDQHKQIGLIHRRRPASTHSRRTPAVSQQHRVNSRAFSAPFIKTLKHTCTHRFNQYCLVLSNFVFTGNFNGSTLRALSQVAGLQLCLFVCRVLLLFTFTFRFFFVLIVYYVFTCSLHFIAASSKR